MSASVIAALALDIIKLTADATTLVLVTGTLADFSAVEIDLGGNSLVATGDSVTVLQDGIYEVVQEVRWSGTDDPNTGAKSYIRVNGVQYDLAHDFDLIPAATVDYSYTHTHVLQLSSGDVVDLFLEVDAESGGFPALPRLTVMRLRPAA